MQYIGLIIKSKLVCTSTKTILQSFKSMAQFPGHMILAKTVHFEFLSWYYWGCWKSWIFYPHWDQLSFIKSEAFSAIIIVGALVLPETIFGMTDASTTRRPLIPFTLKKKFTNVLLRLSDTCVGHVKFGVDLVEFV